MTVLNTPRLRLRKPTDADRAGGVGFLMSHRSRFMGGPYGADAARADWDMVCSMWAKCGFGLLVLTVTNDDRALGLAGPFMPEGHPEPELAWNLWDAANEGKGLATEAAIAARDWAFAICRFPTMVSYIHPENYRSAALAARVGATLDADAPCPYPPPVLIYRHLPKGHL